VKEKLENSSRYVSQGSDVATVSVRREGSEGGRQCDWDLTMAVPWARAVRVAVLMVTVLVFAVMMAEEKYAMSLWHDVRRASESVQVTRRATCHLKRPFSAVVSQLLRDKTVP
jgi:hypothetical protein